MMDRTTCIRNIAVFSWMSSAQISFSALFPGIAYTEVQDFSEGDYNNRAGNDMRPVGIRMLQSPGAVPLGVSL